MPEKARWISSAVVLGGNGAMGSLFCTQLARDIDHVTAIDSDTASPLRTDNVVSLYADACNLSGEAKAALADADLVIMALPEHVASSALGGITSSLRPKALLVDTLSVKTHIVKAIGDIRPSGESLSINPMFAPSLGFAGQSTAVIILDRGPLASRFLELMESWGCQLVFLTAEEHDRMTAMLQTITHAAILTFGMALHKLDYDLVAVEPLMPPPHRTMLALVARILNADPEVYWDIQSSNPFAAGARAALEDGVRELCQVVDRENRADFRHIVDTLHSLFGEESLQIFQEYCGRMFQLR
ncbi:MAG: prephenate dehydrogenase/arogenate dehydrogenase family protein [Gammaproteobacteria bacterium]|jgi:prephenate dehydrogenase